MELEIHRKGEIYLEKVDDDLVYQHTKVNLRAPGAVVEFYYAKMTSQCISKPINIDELDKVRIPFEHIQPLADPSFTRAPPELLLSTSHYVKHPSLMYYEPTNNHTQFLNDILSEIRICEIVRQSPYPNIAKYHGSVVNEETGRISGFVFDKYRMTLAEMLKDDGPPFDRQRCLRGIEAGINHLHGLGLVRNDINATNVMMDHDMESIMIDFDSCRKEGEKLGSKFGWTVDSEYSRRENDHHNLDKIRETLTLLWGGGGGRNVCN
ncbi:hypothetical protein B0H66DRAFT_470558 [Apodospora peruviana]|uniref:Protein kinase domain-containing protein n=1 Tax=Apodospora peruviana TaxID=516989 RepID=A0AAE0IGW3_9PEZI|nr:hypothetical protein B0H66DRAFT_470558 [Apodospora peruviana]